mmetsp:Transcript_83720/g.260113  ORF Transcript_83720/g.260113 Transcript_83720/m.260113 type:complete len:231 (-) Transcript_83720:1314-2006(-)
MAALTISRTRRSSSSSRRYSALMRCFSAVRPSISRLSSCFSSLLTMALSRCSARKAASSLLSLARALRSRDASSLIAASAAVRASPRRYFILISLFRSILARLIRYHRCTFLSWAPLPVSLEMYFLYSSWCSRRHLSCSSRFISWCQRDTSKPLNQCSPSVSWPMAVLSSTILRFSPTACLPIILSKPAWSPLTWSSPALSLFSWSSVSRARRASCCSRVSSRFLACPSS